MRKSVVVFGLFCAAAAAAVAQSSSQHVMVTPDAVKWGPAPPALPAGGQVMVLDGDPSKAGPFALRLKMPAGYRIPPHWHPTDEHVVVLQGALLIGMGDKLVEGEFKTLPAGSYGRLPAKTPHFAGAKEETVLVVYGTGPFEVTYVNPSDDPRKKKGPTAQQ
jgi:quercetin dioxygenase-like cupin family protein